MTCYQRAQLGLFIVAILVLVLGILAIFAAANMVYQKEINKWKVSVYVWVCVSVWNVLSALSITYFKVHWMPSQVLYIITRHYQHRYNQSIGSCLVTLLYTCNAVNFKVLCIMILHCSLPPISSYMHTYTVQFSFLDHSHLKQYPLHLPAHIRMAVGGGLPLSYSGDMCF